MGATLGGLVAGRSASEDEAGNRVYRQVYRVTTSDRSDGPRAVAAVLPVRRGDYYRNGNPGDPWYEEDRFAFVRSIEVAQQANEPTTWFCTVEFGPLDPTISDPENPGNSTPLLDEPVVELDAEEREMIVDIDRNGNAVVNSANDRFDPPVTRDDARHIIIVERNEASFNLATARVYRNAVNATPFLGFPAGHVLCKRLTARRQYNTLIGVYYRVRYEFHIGDPQHGWKKRILDAGMRQIEGGQHRPIMVESANGERIPVSEPVPLNGAGQPLPPSGTPVYREFDIYPTADFSALGLE